MYIDPHRPEVPGTGTMLYWSVAAVTWFAAVSILMLMAVFLA